MVNTVRGFQRAHSVTDQNGTRIEGYTERDNSKTIKLFDVVDMTWTKPLPEYTQLYMMRKLVVKCSACKWTTGPLGNGIEGHLKQLREKHEVHVGAQSGIASSEMGGSKITCSACIASFQDAIAFKRHMIQFNPEILEQHESAVPQVINRFVLEQPAVSNEVSYISLKPESAQMARSQRPAGTRRRRGKRGRGGR
jgi:hypothetical protein